MRQQQRASGWVEAEASTCQMPTNCGGTGPLGIGGGGRGGGAAEVYSWDQTPTHVEICIPAPRDCTAKQVTVRVKPRSIEVLVGGEAVFAAGTGRASGPPRLYPSPPSLFTQRQIS